MVKNTGNATYTRHNKVIEIIIIMMGKVNGKCNEGSSMEVSKCESVTE